MLKRYWLSTIIKDVLDPNTLMVRGVDIIESVSIPGQLSDVVGGFNRLRGSGPLGKRVILMTYVTPETELLLEGAGLIPLGRSHASLKAQKSKIPLLDRSLVNDLDENFPNVKDQLENGTTIFG